ncbi:hypothetical protein [Streptococcus gallolyticus]|uniref:hypothetical protein n=1 Tax=Streptococcus gallolyticus TaxID=315405 RepID=UPI002284BE1B|nr:hypothetical protein [Streptococcus gallolyticus]MCY7179252.1 hypothetical protein [Streptococcus gallolyticus subsp. gallolyticus]
MTQSNVLPKIQAIVSQVNAKRDVLDGYKQELETAKTELEQAKADRKASFTFETDKKVVELESFILRIERRYTELKQSFETESAVKLREVEELYNDYVAEKWATDTGVKELTQRTVEGFKNATILLDQYTRKPSEINKQAYSEVVDDDFKQAFKGLTTFIGANRYSLATAIPIGYEVYQKLYSAGRELGVKFE